MNNKFCQECPLVSAWQYPNFEVNYNTFYNYVSSTENQKGSNAVQRYAPFRIRKAL